MVIQGVSYPSDFEAKKSIIAAAAVLSGKGSMPAGDGSLSVRVGPNAVWITVDGADKTALTQDMMVRVDLAGRQSATNKPKPLGCDLESHLRLYRENNNIRSVIHAYPVRAVVFGAENRELSPASLTPAVRRLGRLQLITASDPQKAAENIALCAKSDHGVLIKNEGCMMWGGSVTEVLSYFETLDYYCRALRYLDRTVHAESKPTETISCSGDCGDCSRKSVCDSCNGECRPSGVSYPSALPKGMTGIIRPGAPLPCIPKEKNNSCDDAVSASSLPEAAFEQPENTAVITAVPVSGNEKEVAAAVSDSSGRHPSISASAVVNAPKAAVISEVVRRTISL